MSFSTRERWISACIATAAITLLAIALLMSGCSSDGAMIKTGKDLQIALGSYEAEQGHYPEALTWASIDRELVDENGNPYLVVSTADYSLYYSYYPAGDDVGIGYDSYEAYLMQRNGGDFRVVRITPQKVEVTKIESVPTD